jgi:hypothetical protein
LDNSGGVLDGCKFDMGESAGLAIRFRCFRSWSLIRFMYDVKWKRKAGAKLNGRLTETDRRNIS